MVTVVVMVVEVCVGRDCFGVDNGDGDGRYRREGVVMMVC